MEKGAIMQVYVAVIQWIPGNAETEKHVFMQCESYAVAWDRARRKSWDYAVMARVVSVEPVAGYMYNKHRIQIEELD